MRPRLVAAYAALLHCYPGEFRRRFGAEMADVFAAQLAAARARGPVAVFALWWRTIAALLHTALLEHLDAWRSTPIAGRRENMFESVRADLRFAGRMLRKSPVFTATAVLCIALGSGAVATIFSAMNAMILRPLPGASAPEALVRVERKEPGSTDGVSASYPYFRRLAGRSQTADLVAWGKASLSLRGAGSGMGTAVYGSFVSANFFRVLGVRARLGRFFVPADDTPGAAEPPIVVSESFWRAHLGADSAAIGRPLWVNGRRFTLVGVASSEFVGLDAPIECEAWIPLATRRLLLPTALPLDDPAEIWLRVAARVHAGAAPERVHAELSAITAAMALDGSEPSWMAKYGDARLSPLTGLPPDATAPLAAFLGVLLAAAALVLMIASVDVGAMLSARAIMRRREMAVRAALGAARGRLVRQLLTEILVLFALGAAGGFVLATGATAAIERLPIPAEVRITLRITPDYRVFVFAVAVSLLTGLVVGLVPALRAARADVAARLRDGTAGSGTRRTPIAGTLVVGQLALSLVLLVGAGLFVRSLQRAGRIDPGFDAAGVTTARLDTEAWGYDEPHGRVFLEALRGRIAGLPGIESVAYTTILPLTLQSSVESIRLDGRPDQPSGGVQVHNLQVSADYFTTLRLPIVAGRAIAASDDQRAPRVAVVNATFARRFWPDGSALGRTFRYGDQRITIVGIARDARYASLTEQWEGSATPPMVYFPLVQQWRPRVSLMVRSRTSSTALAGAVQRAVGAIDPSLPAPRVVSLNAAMSLGLFPQRVAAIVTGTLGVVGLLLATIGLYGVIAFSVGRRSREIGIRLALGARRSDVLAMIVRDGMRLTIVGLAAGVGLALLSTRLIATYLAGLDPLDAPTYLAMTALFGGVALVASIIPARRAAGSDPMMVLRSE